MDGQQPAITTGTLEAIHVALARHGYAGGSGVPMGATGLVGRINYGRWIADCDRCNGAELVVIEAGGVGRTLCQSCLVQGKPPVYRAVKLPANRDEIERVLAGRPLAHRNWEPGESLAVLRRQNEEQGD